MQKDYAFHMLYDQVNFNSLGGSMHSEITIYLAGKIQKAHENSNEVYWTQEYQDSIRAALDAYNVFFLDPAVRSDDLSIQKSVFGRDMVQVFSADVVFVDARERRGLGVGAEMMWAKINRIPVVTLAPVESHYHKHNTSLLGVEVTSWIHPFVENLSDKIVESVSDGAMWIEEIMQGGLSTIKGPESIQEAMQYYMETQFPFDHPMQELENASNSLKSRLESIKTSV